MLKVISDLREKAKSKKQRIVLPEGDDRRVLEAAGYVNKEKLADLIILGEKNRIVSFFKDKGYPIEGIEIIEPSSSPYLENFSNTLYNILKAKGATLDETRRLLIEKPVYFGAMLVREEMASGFVAGAAHTTRDVARAGLHCIGLDLKIGTMSSTFIMVLDDESFGERGVLVFADCAIVPQPSPKQLANIAISASDLMEELFSVAPKIAMLSFSTKGSGSGPETEKIIKAVEIVKQMRPDLLIDGELQGDTALVPEVAKIKAPDSPIAGKANILVFPNLEAGNIAYKLTQRLAKARALGPLLHGLLAPCSDLSRGCDATDIVDIICVTAIRCGYNQ